MKSRLKFIVMLLGTFAVAPATTASAQSETQFIEAFAGEWQIHDDAFARNSERCRLVLHRDSQDGNYRLDNRSCGAELESVSRWGIADGQMVLLAGKDAVATLGGNQRRVSGTARSGKPIILERVSAAGGGTSQLRAAYRSSGCYYLGFTDRCAAEVELSKPTISSEGGARINVIVNLNVRAQAREDASVIGVVPANTCVVADACATATDGVWCRARFGDRTGWLRKVALRKNRWPVLTFLNQCPTAEWKK